MSTASSSASVSVGVIPIVPPVLSSSQKYSSNKVEKQRYLNHIQYKYEQSKRMIHEEFEPIVKKHMEEVIESTQRKKKYLTDDELPPQRSLSFSSLHQPTSHSKGSGNNNPNQAIPKSLITKFVSHDNRLSTSDEKIENTTLTLQRLGMKSALAEVNALIQPPNRHLPTLNTTNISLSPQTKYPHEAIVEDDLQSEQVALASTSLASDQHQHRRIDGGANAMMKGGATDGSMTSTLKSRLYAITNNQRSPTKAQKYVTTIQHETKLNSN